MSFFSPQTVGVIVRLEKENFQVLSMHNKVGIKFLPLFSSICATGFQGAVEIPCPTCPTWSHFIQDKLKISIYLSLDKCKICYKVNKILYFIFRLIIMSSHVALKTVWILISWLIQKPADLDLHC